MSHTEFWSQDGCLWILYLTAQVIAFSVTYRFIHNNQHQFIIVNLNSLLFYFQSIFQYHSAIVARLHCEAIRRYNFLSFFPHIVKKKEANLQYNESCIIDLSLYESA